MTRDLLWRGLLAGLVAGLLAVGFARLFGEASVQHAIDFESAASLARGEAPEPELVSRAIQRGPGLLVAGAVYGAALGGLFAVAFAACLGRVRLAPRTLAGWLAAAGLVAVVLVPQLKYPANPPAVGEPDTIGMRTALYFEAILASCFVVAASAAALRALSARMRTGYAAMLAFGVFACGVLALQYGLPTIDEVPAGFPAGVLWHFRLASLGMQLVLWGTLGALFGELAERRLSPASRGAGAFGRA